MTPVILSTIGLVLTLAAAVLLVLNLQIDSAAWTFWIGISLMTLGVACCIAAAKKGVKK